MTTGAVVVTWKEKWGMFGFIVVLIIVSDCPMFVLFTPVIVAYCTTKGKQNICTFFDFCQWEYRDKPSVYPLLLANVSAVLAPLPQYFNPLIKYLNLYPILEANNVNQLVNCFNHLSTGSTLS